MRTNASERNNDVRSVATTSNVLAWLCLTDELASLQLDLLRSDRKHAIARDGTNREKLLRRFRPQTYQERCDAQRAAAGSRLPYSHRPPVAQ